METKVPHRQTRLLRQGSPASTFRLRTTIGRLLWATAIVAFACFWGRLLTGDHYYVALWLFFALVCGAVGTIFGGHLGAWIGMGAFGVFLPLIFLGGYVIWQSSAIAAMICVVTGLHILNLPSIAARYYGKRSRWDVSIASVNPGPRRKRAAQHGNLGCGGMDDPPRETTESNA